MTSAIFFGLFLPQAPEFTYTVGALDHPGINLNLTTAKGGGHFYRSTVESTVI